MNDEIQKELMSGMVEGLTPWFLVDNSGKQYCSMRMEERLDTIPHTHTNGGRHGKDHLNHSQTLHNTSYTQ